MHVCNRFLDCNNKNVSKVKETKDKKLCNVLPRNMVDHSDKCQEPEQVRFNFSSYNLFGDEKGVLHKELGFAYPSKTIEHSEFSIPFDILFRHIMSLEVDNSYKECVKSRVAHIHQLNRFMRFLEYSFP